MGKIVQINEYKLKKYIKEFIYTGKLHQSLCTSKGIPTEVQILLDSNLSESIKEAYRRKETLKYTEKISIFEAEYSSVIKHLRSSACKFKYPTILSKYSKTINPLIAIHQELQKCLLYPERSHTNRWVLNSFLNHTFLDDAKTALESDIMVLNLFYVKNKNSKYKHIQKRLEELNQFNRKLIYCLEEINLLKNYSVDIERDMG